MTPLEKDTLLYAKTGKVEKLQGCLKAGVSPNLADDARMSLLMHAAYRGHYPIVEELLRRGADANYVGHEDSTALFQARQAGRLAILELLQAHTHPPPVDEVTRWDYPCPCCGYLTFCDPPNSNDICQICFWQDEHYQLVFPEAWGGANKPSLIEAQRNFATCGASKADMRNHVLAPLHSSRRDPGWRPLNVARDPYLREEIEADLSLWYSVMKGDPCLYYWRPDYWLLSHRTA